MTPDGRGPSVSVVVPAWRAEQTIEETLESLLRQTEPNWEVVVVDDGSIDDSEAVLAELAEQYEWVQVVQLSRNFGQHPATMAGVLHASGDWIATLDEDLQHHPKFLLTLLRQAVEEQHDVVYAHPEAAVHESPYRDLASRAYKRLIARLSNNPHVVRFNSFRMMRGSIARAAAAAAAHQTYYDLAVCWFTMRIGTTVLPLKDHRYIRERRSGYSLRSLLSHARRMLESSEVKALRFGAALGVLVMVLSAFAAVWVVLRRLLYPELIGVQGWASLMVVVTFFGGLSAFLTGLVLEHLSIVLLQSQGKPTFFEVDRRSDHILRAWFQQRDAAG